MMASFDVEAFIDRQRIGRRQIGLLAVCTLVLFIDGFDVFMIGKIAPAIAADFKVPTKDLTLLITFQQIGLAVGAFVMSPIADRHGRKRILILCLLAFGLLTLAGIFARSLMELAVLRGIAGIFMSAGMPITLALISEMTPRHRRSTFVAIGMAGFATGSTASGIVAAWLLDIYGWESGFWIGGLVPLLCVPLMLLFVPESLKLRVSRNPRDPRVAATIRRLDPSVTLSGEEHFVLGSSREPQAAKLADVFEEGRAPTTLILWCCCLLSMGNIALLGAWLPTFFQEMAGVPIQRFAILAMIAYAGGFAGTLSIGWMMDRLRPTWLIAAYFLGIATVLTALGHVPAQSSLFLLLLIIWSFCQTGGQAGLNAFITQLYPPRMRSTGLGWAGGAGRVGGVIVPLFGGLALAQHFTLQTTLMCIALPPIAVACLILLLDRLRQISRPGALQPAPN
jgi:AAHS family 4-hydroxybenzoate transporter-like MFS transporter